MYKNLAAFIEKLDRAGELARITAQVDPVYEITEITDRQSKLPGGGKALLFENTGTAFPVITNMFGSDKRIAMALGVEGIGELTERIDKLFSAFTSPKPTIKDKLSVLPLLGEAARWLPKEKRGKGECQQVIYKGNGIKLSLLPILKCWPFDGGRFVTLPLVNTIDPNSGIRNVGMYRMQVFSENTTGMHWHMHKTGERHYRAYQEKGLRMPVSVCIGGDPAYMYAATAPMPDGMDEYLLAGFIRRKPVELVRCVTNDIMVPSDCDFVIEGYVDTAEEKVMEGAFGDHTGFYSLKDLYPTFHVTALTHRRNAIYPATIVGVPPQEDAYIAKATERIFLSPIRMAVLPEIRDMYMPPEGVSHNIVIADIEKSYAGQGFKTANSMWGAGQMMFNKFLVITSGMDDIRNTDTLRERLRRIDIGRDLLFSRGPLDVLDHSAPEKGFGGKLAFDTTNADLNKPVAPVYIPENIVFGHGIDSADISAAETWSCLILKVKHGETPDAAGFMRANTIKGVKFVLILDAAFDTPDLSSVLWFAAGNTDPHRDIRIEDGMLFIDARIKAGGVNGFSREWPNIVTSSKDTVGIVDKRWEEYGLGQFIFSPSLRYIKLHKGDAEYGAVEI